MGWVFLILGSCAVLVHYRAADLHERALDRRLKNWRIKYALNDAEVARLRALEESFHGSGGLFPRGQPTPEESARHRLEIAALLPADAAQRFLKPAKGNQAADPSDEHE